MSVYADEARVDVGDLRRKQSAAESALAALEERLGLVRDYAAKNVEDAPAVLPGKSRQDSAAALLEAPGEQTTVFALSSFSARRSARFFARRDGTTYTTGRLGFLRR